MDFKLSEEQQMLHDMVRKISENEFGPRAAEIDQKEEFPWENKKILEENGLLGIQIPEEYGGAGAGMVSLAIVVEEVARVCASTSAILTTQALATDPLLIGGSHDQKIRWLRPMAEGSALGACAITESGAGSDVTGIKTVATSKKSGYVINGTKIFITNGGVSDIITVVAYTDKTKANKGMSMLVVTKDTPGFSVGKDEKKLGIRGSDTRELIFEDCFVPEENVIGKPGDGFRILMKTFNYTRPAVASQALGIAQGAMDAAVNYCKDRIQFGKPISEFQGIQWMIAEMALNIELSRTMIYRTCATIDNEPDSKNIPRLASMAKWFASDMAMQVTTDAVQLFGGYGYSREYPVERMMRDAKITQIYEGTNQVQRIIIANQILR
ncbi:MAG: acyl-CoA dehydrogenase family protein [Deltaproteobacteria bacterium]|nr:acyl-CoA dehydrogenase family protein [Deltaproteobacteria bacterium]MBW2004109.1 acyl-CoA dehydrogenase family protein [Deltaproteobacteria bacterium]